MNNNKLYTWLESDTGKGSNEVCSALHHFLHSIKNRVVHRRIKRLDLFADSCPGQNKNFSMLTFLLRFIKSPDCKFQTITITFPIWGHSFMKPDRIFSVIEKDIRKQQVIATPDKYHSILEKHGRVKVYGRDWQVFDHKLLAKQLLRSNTNVPMQNSKVWVFHRGKNYCI